MDSDICHTLLDQLPVETLCIGMDGEVKFANRSALALLGRSGTEDKGNFFDHLSDPRDKIAATVQRCAGSSAWQPISVQMGRGGFQGLNVAMRCRGIRTSETLETQALLVTDRGRKPAFEEHRRLIRQLNQELAEQRRIRARLDNALTNETRLHAELIHRVKNNLALLNSLIRTKISASDDPQVKEALSEIQARVLSIALVHELLDRNKQIDVVDARDLLDQLCDQMESSICPPGVTINRELLPYKLHVEEATPLALLVNELVTNSIKHAFAGRESGKVDVALRRNGVDKIEVHVADDGAGFAGEDEASGTGSRIVRALAQQLRGELSVSSGDGTSWQLIFAPSDIGENSREPH